ncbi:MULTISPECIES: GNAT family N-acetyltransferase [Thalassospira]|uniref:GNAT family N-acetyltransferase n=1 Tax=Thalassospira povalilytica TaxID=732237 RepID=A0A8I1SIW3_9PROT|nr:MULTISPECIES: GNAT family N-acetyltransferase [Thalassospira]MEE3046884.1 GNAT family N-acetyltransferase [Pseudomonadota bacterium]RCK22765.1 GNAT family acetyltransferase [Thalassospira profundimaris]KZB59953.1 GNAT family acetyltransferase [Thalassospira sp. MCCC 1A02491]MAL41239.1 N-acetyltransferase [Thalassospira sp.]MBN8196209.1 GNAT family N-acetyltransferase [Thalassospira povalilytica]|tara:strand:- start:158 stop:634 length:477 start_codon:yes stop_codon:yes gene_type:complete
MQIRKGTADDLPFIRDLTKRATDSTYFIEGMGDAATNLVARYVEQSTSVFENALGSDNHTVYVATKDDILLGYVIAIHNSPEIDWIMVDPASHGSGAGKALMMAALDALSEKGARSNVRLKVVAHNERAKAFYRKFGFLVTGPVPDREVPTVEMQRAA